MIYRNFITEALSRPLIPIYNIRARDCIGGGHLQTDRDPTGGSFEQKKLSRGCNKDRKDALYKYKDY